MNIIKEFEEGSGGRVQLVNGEIPYVYKIPHKFIPKETQVLEYQTQKSLWEKYNEGFVKPLFLEEEGNCIAMEWFNGSKISFRSVRDQDKVAKILCGCFKAMEEEGVYHNDLGFHNILWNRNTDDLKLIDFGNIAKFQDDEEKKKCYLMSDRRPEEFNTFDGLPPSKLLKKKEAMRLQIWNLGCLLLEIFLSKLIFIISPVRTYDSLQDFHDDLKKLNLEEKGFIGKAIITALCVESSERRIL